jgi:NAD(P)-dependent dehydrogenase (short-subunit alcohol dehydrogenase family)/enamine deaminase RidA (YjgF/YER057c/UK114 family)
VTSLAGRVAVVTGAGRGIGAASARTLAAAGCSVVVAARSRERIERVATELAAIGCQARPVVCDVTSEESVRALCREAGDLGPAAVLVNNAGAAASMPVTRTSLEEWNRLLAVNATGAFLCTRAFLPGMIEQKWGRVVNVASTAGLAGARYISAYAAAKHALMGFTRSAAAEMAGTGVTVNAVCPGYVDTEMTTETLARIVAKTGRSREEALAAALAAAGQSRLITAEEVAAAVVSLCADIPAPLNGEALILDGREAMSSRFTVINPEELGAPRGWNNGMLAQAGGRVFFIAGQTARDSSGRVPASDFVSQFDQALGRVLAVLRQAGGVPEDIGRLTIYVTDVSRYRAALEPLGAAYRRLMGTHYPAMALVEVKGLVDERALVEIEATAVLGGG